MIRDSYYYMKRYNIQFLKDYNGTTSCSNDICLIEELYFLFEAGIDAFKILYLQSEEYINVVTEQYR